MVFNLDDIIRPHLKNLKPYSSARDEYSGTASVFLDANENAYGSVIEKDYSRYPDPLQWEVKEKIAHLKGVNKHQIFLGNGSDEAIDLLFRMVCRPKEDKVIILPPTYGMYKVSAEINDVDIINVNLTTDFQPDLNLIFNVIEENTKMIFFCSPNNPTGNAIDPNAIYEVLKRFEGIVVVDEAYIDFSEQESFVKEIENYPNLVVLQTFSKAWGLAALRLGLAFASEAIISLLNKIKPPYNINGATQVLALQAIENKDQKDRKVAQILANREQLKVSLEALRIVEKVYESDANFLLVRVEDAIKVYKYLEGRSIIVRDRSKVALCEGCLRITVGTEEENEKLIESLQKY